jgi:hypothetical protein
MTIYTLIRTTVLVAFGIVSSTAGTSKDEARIFITADRSCPTMMSRLALGVTHAQYSLDSGGDWEIVAEAKDLLQSSCRYQNQHIMGWGALNPNPEPGIYRWGSLDRRIVAAIHASVLIHMILSGSSVALLWQPMKVGKLDHALFSDVRKPGGIEIYPHYHVFKAIHEYFGPSIQLYKATPSSSDVEVLASATKLLLINKRPESVKVLVNGKPVDLGCYEVRLLDS